MELAATIAVVATFGVAFGLMSWHRWRALSDAAPASDADDSSLVWLVMSPLVIAAGGALVLALEGRRVRAPGAVVAEVLLTGAVLVVHRRSHDIAAWLRTQGERLDRWPERRRKAS